MHSTARHTSLHTPKASQIGQTFTTRRSRITVDYSLGCDWTLFHSKKKKTKNADARRNLFGPKKILVHAYLLVSFLQESLDSVQLCRFDCMLSHGLLICFTIRTILNKPTKLFLTVDLYILFLYWRHEWALDHHAVYEWDNQLIVKSDNLIEFSARLLNNLFSLPQSVYTCVSLSNHRDRPGLLL